LNCRRILQPVARVVFHAEPVEGAPYPPVGGALTYAQGPYVRYGKNCVGACRFI